MRKFMIEREMPAIGSAEEGELKAIARISNKALRELGGRVKWLHSYVAAHKTYCVYLASDEATFERYTQMTGFPADKVVEITGMIDPSTAD
jgi:hypothetical protein